MHELLHLLGATKAHDPFNASPVVPTAVEDHDLAARGEMLHIALEVPLGLLLIGGGCQGHDPAAPRVERIGDALDRAALAGRVAPLKDNDQAKA